MSYYVYITVYIYISPGGSPNRVVIVIPVKAVLTHRTTTTLTMSDRYCTGQEVAVGGRDGCMHRQDEMSLRGGGLHGPSSLPNVDLPTLELKKSDKIPFTHKVEQSYVDEKKANSDRKDYVGGAAVGGVSGGLAGAGTGGAAGVGVGALVGGILGSVVPGPGTALGALIGAGVGGGIGALAGGGAGGGIGTGVGAGIVAKLKRKKKNHND